MGSDADLRKLEAKIRKKEEQKGAKPEAAPEKEKKPAEKPKREEMRSESIMRLAETNLDGMKKVSDVIRGVRGISFMMANAIAGVSGMGNKKLIDLSEQERAKLEDMIMHAEKYGIPKWMYNRKRDIQIGIDRHLAVSELEFGQKTDIDFMKKIKTYKGVRHSLGLPVRGQRTRSSFRAGSTVGVVKKKEEPKAKPKEGKEAKK